MTSGWRKLTFLHCKARHSMAWPQSACPYSISAMVVFACSSVPPWYERGSSYQKPVMSYYQGQNNGRHQARATSFCSLYNWKATKTEREKAECRKTVIYCWHQIGPNTSSQMEPHVSGIQERGWKWAIMPNANTVHITRVWTQARPYSAKMTLFSSNRGCSKRYLQQMRY